MKKEFMLFLLVIFITSYFLGGVFGQNSCPQGEITSTCHCGDSIYNNGYCCNNIWFDSYYENIIGGCPSDNFYYVDINNPSASDSNPGTQDLPWLTMEQGVSQVSAGETLIVKQGTYRVIPLDSRYNPSLNPVNSGTSGNPIIFKAEGEVTITSQYSESGVAQGGTQNSIILSSGASSIDEYYTGWYVRITSGTGAGQYRKILANFYDFNQPSYFGDTKEAIVNYPWSIIPDSTSQYTLTKSGALFGTYNRNYIVYDGFRVIERDSYHPDTGCTVIWSSNNIFLINNEIQAQNVGLYDNHNAIRVGGSSNFTIRNNKIYGVMPTFTLGNNPQNHAGIMIYTSSNGLIENNEIYDSYTGIFPKGGYGNHIIRYNYIHDCIKCLRISYHDNVDVYQNLFENCEGIAFQPAEENTDIDVFNNIIYNSESGVNNWFEITEISFWNNIYLNVIRPMSFEGGSGTFYSDYNDYFNYLAFRVGNRDIGGLSDWQALGFDTNSIEVNPLFVNPSSLDFHLQSSSPLISAGIDRQDYDSDGNTEESIPLGAYITGDECVGLISGCVTDSSYCGDGVCEGGEDCLTCPADCPTGSNQVCCSGVLYTGDCCDNSDCVSPETCVSHVCTLVSQCSPADSDSSGVVSITELINYISEWKMGNVLIGDLINGIWEWKNGCS